MTRTRLRSVLALAAVLVVIVAVLVLSQAPGGLSGLFAPPSPEERADQVLAGIKAEDPDVALLEQHRPEVYAELRATLVESASDGATVMEMANDGRRVIVQWMSGAIAKAPDDVVLNMLAVTTSEFRELLESNPNMCAAMILGRPFADPADFLSEDLRQRQLQAFEALLTAPAQADVVTLPPAEVDAAFAQINPDLRARFGDDLALMSLSNVPDDKSARVCEIRIATLELVQAFTSSRVAAMARALLGQM